MNNQILAKNLRELLSKPLDPYLFPVKRGNKINIGSYSIIKINQGYSVKCYRTNTIIAETYSKSAAIAIAKNLSKNRNITKQITELDDIYSKNYIDCLFYTNFIKKTKNFMQKEATLMRYEISNQKCIEAKNKIESYIL